MADHVTYTIVNIVESKDVSSTKRRNNIKDPLMVLVKRSVITNICLAKRTHTLHKVLHKVGYLSSGLQYSACYDSNIYV